MPQLLRTVSMPTRFPSANTEGSLLACHASGCEIAANLTDQAELRGSYRPLTACGDWLISFQKAIANLSNSYGLHLSACGMIYAQY